MWHETFVRVFVVLLAASYCCAQEPTTQPTTQPATPATSQPTTAVPAEAVVPPAPPTPAAPDYTKRLNDLVALIEGQNSPEVRRTGVQELLAQAWPETAPRLAAILGGANDPAKAAIASVLAQWPKYLDPLYVDPLLAMLAAENADLQTAAGRALAAYPNGDVIPRLRAQALATDRPARARLGAIFALGLMPQRSALDSLAAVLGDADADVVAAALRAFQQATAMEFEEDPAAAQRWWAEMAALSDQDWQRFQIERLVRSNGDLRAQLQAVEHRLMRVLEANFQRAPDAERATLLAEYLADDSLSMRLLGLRLTQRHLAEGKPLDSLLPETYARIRALLSSAVPREQEAAVQTVTTFRDPADAQRFIDLLVATQHRAVRLALINGLGYVGDGPATQALLGVLEGADPKCTTEAVAALGRLAERGALHDDALAAVVAALQNVFAHTDPTQVALRERVLWAMGNVADPSFGAAFAKALDASEAVAVRQAAVRGIAVLKDPKLADALADAASDPDVRVRKTAIETLAQLGSSERHLQALWDRLANPPETEEAIRQAAWRSALALIEKRPPAEIDTWIDRLGGDAASRGPRALELLERLLRIVESTDPVDSGRVGEVRARIAAQHAALQHDNEAIDAYVKALNELHGARPEAAQQAALQLLRLALATNRYNPAIAEAVHLANPGPSGEAVWGIIKGELEPRLNEQGAPQVLTVLDVLEANPPGEWSPDALAGLAALRAQAMQIIQPPPATQPTTQPAPAATSQPVQ